MVKSKHVDSYTKVCEFYNDMSKYYYRIDVSLSTNSHTIKKPIFIEGN
uniref:Uncharacterized protein n=1 Tax=Nesodiprion zhejiangensis nucleopolyhedrovirus TaxID=3135970 RepID=A0AAN0LHH9_9BACU